MVAKIGLVIVVLAVLLIVVAQAFAHALPMIEALDLGAHFATLSALVIGMIWIGGKIDVLHMLVNSRMTGTLELQATKSYAEGVKAEYDRNLQRK